MWIPSQMATGYKMYADSQDFNSSVGFPSVISYEAAIQRLTGMSVSSLAHRACYTQRLQKEQEPQDRVCFNNWGVKFLWSV